jgi:hypothetical protein
MRDSQQETGWRSCDTGLHMRIAAARSCLTCVALPRGKVAMNPERLKVGGILFIVGGMIFLVSGVFGERTVFFVLGCAFLAIGAGFLAQARRGKSA